MVCVCALCPAERRIILVRRGVGMKKQARVLKHGLMAILLAVVAIFPVVMVDKAMSAEDVERIPFALDTLKADKMPPVFFSHDLHQETIAKMKGFDDVNETCASCHETEDGSIVSSYFLDSENQTDGEVMAYVHDSCVSCHAKVADGKPTGPALASCRSCHDSAIAAQQAAQ